MNALDMIRRCARYQLTETGEPPTAQDYEPVIPAPERGSIYETPFFPGWCEPCQVDHDGPRCDTCQAWLTREERSGMLGAITRRCAACMAACIPPA